MFGKNNFDEKLRRMEMQAKKDRFSIRKLAVGVASVLLGFSFMGAASQTAKADTLAAGQQETVVANKQVNAKDVANKPKLSTFSGLSAFLRGSEEESSTSEGSTASQASEASSASSSSASESSSSSQASESSQASSASQASTGSSASQASSSGSEASAASTGSVGSDGAQKIKTTHANDIVIHHLLVDADGNKTAKPVIGLGDEKGDTYIDGYVGDTRTISATDPEQTAPDGYKIVADQKSVTWTFVKDQNKEITFYYTQVPTTQIDPNMPFSKQFSAPLSYPAVAYSAITVGNNTQLRYFFGSTSDGSGTVYPAFPNYSLWKNGSYYGGVFYPYEGTGTTSPKVLKLGLGNKLQDISPSATRIWQINSDNSDGGTVTELWSADYMLGNRTYTFDFTSTLKPIGNLIDYTTVVKNVTGLDSNPTPDPANDLSGVNFSWWADTDFLDNDHVSFYYQGANQGLYMSNNGYRLNWNFSDLTKAPTGWKAVSYFSETSSVFGTADALGQNSTDPATAPAKGDTAFDGGDSELALVWNSQKLNVGETRTIGYSANIVDENAPKPKIEITSQFANYYGGPLKVEGKITESDPNSLPLHYYYQVSSPGDSGTPIEFFPDQTPSAGNPTVPFTLNISGLTVGQKHNISIYAIDRYSVSSDTVSVSIPIPPVSPLTVKYVDQNGNPLLDDSGSAVSDKTIQAGAAGTAYNVLTGGEQDSTKPNNVSHYTYDSVVSGTAQGTFGYGDPDHPETNPYIITLKFKGNTISADSTDHLTVNYLLQGKNIPLATSDYKGGAYGDKVTVTAKTIAGYTVAGSGTQEYTFTPTGNKTVIFYYTANKTNDTNNVIVHHYLQKPDGTLTTDTVPGMSDTHVDGYVGDTVTVKAADKDQTAPDGYTLVTADQTSEKLTATGNQTVTFYYTANKTNDTNNVIVHHYLQTPDGKATTDTVPGMSDTHVDGYVGDTVTVKATDKDQTAPDGYTLVTADQTSGKLTATGNQTVTFYYTANKTNDTNNVIVHHYLQKPDGTLTTDTVPGMSDTHVDGYVGDTVTVKAADKDQTAPDGYTLVTADQTSGKLTATGNQTVTFYYTANKTNDTNNVIVHHYLQTPDGKATTDTVPGMSDTHVDGYVGDTVTVKAADKDQTAPDGYTLVTADQTSGKLTATGNQTVTFYYTANKTNDTNNVIVHHYLQTPDGKATTDTVPGMSDTHVDGYVGDTVTVKAADKDQTAPDGYTLVTADQTSEKLTATGNQTVTFYYTANKTNDTNNVIVHHYLQTPDGKATTDTVPGMSDTHVDGYVGDTVTVKATDKDQTAPDGYTLVTADQTSGKLTATGNQTVTFYYTANKTNDTNNVIVHHYLQTPDGKATTDTVPGMSDTHVDGYVGDTVTVKAADKDQTAPDGYTLVTADQTSGKLTATGNQTVTFYYTANKTNNTNNVIVHHYLQTPDGKATTDTVPGMSDTHVDGYVGDTVTVKAADKDQTAPDGYTLVTADQTSGKLTATGNQTVTFYYTANKTNDTNNVIVHHYLQKPDGTLTTDTVPGMSDTHVDGYVGDTVTVKAADKDQTAPDGYTLVTADQTSGKLTATGNQTVTFYYTANKTNDTNNVIVHHYLQKPDGRQTTDTVMSDTRVNGYVGSTVTVKAADDAQKAPDGYTLVTTADQTSGKLTATGNQEVIFYYTANKTNDTNNVIVHHYLQTPDGKATTDTVPGMSDTHVDGYVGDTVTVKAADKDQTAPAGYTLVTADQTSAKLTATGNQTVTFYYKGNSSTAANNVVVHHYLQKPDGTLTTTKVLDDTSVDGYVGSTVTVSATDAAQKAPDGYTLVTADQTSAKLTATGNQEVTFYYKGNASNVVVHHYLQDPEGHPTTTPVMNDTSVDGYVGSTVTVKAADKDQKAPDGYTLVTTADQTSGKLTATGNQTVTFYYKGNSSTAANNVVVHHYLQDPEGNPTTTPVMDDTSVDGYVGSTVTVKAADKDQTAPAGYTLVTTADQTSGKLTATGNQTVTFYYKGNSSTAANNVVVHHYLQKPDGTLTTTKVLDDTSVDGYVGSTVTVSATDAAQKAPDGYTLVTADQTSAKLTATGNQEVTFYYKGNASNVVVHHYLQDPEGHPTTTKVLDDTSVDGYVGSTVTVSATDAAQKAPDGYTLVTTADQTSAKLTATGNQIVTFYYKGNSSTAANNVVVHHYLQKPDGTLTTTKVMDDTSVDGYVGSTVTVKATDHDQMAPVGYKLVTLEDQTSAKLTATGNQTVMFYYKSIESPKKQADTYNPKYSGSSVSWRSNITSSSAIKNLITYDASETPSNERYSWKNNQVPSTLRRGRVSGTIIITYSDNSTDEVLVSFMVR